MYKDVTRYGTLTAATKCPAHEYYSFRIEGGVPYSCTGHRVGTQARTWAYLKVRRPGIEPGSTAWKATMLTVTPPTQLF